MSLLALGISHKTASVEVREQATLVPENIRAFLAFAKEKNIADEVVVLSTCNRTEFYFKDLQLSLTEFGALWAQYSQLTESSVERYLYKLEGEAMIRHLFRVAAGLDSLILGEPQIFGQLKDALATAVDFGMAKKFLQRALQMSFNIAKEIRTETEIGAYAVSVAFTAVQLARQIFDGLEHYKVLLVGAGETIELVARHLIESGVSNIMVVNRSQERTAKMIESLGIEAETYPLDQLGELLPEADIVVSSTAAKEALITQPMAQQALKKRRHQPMLMIDLAVPRDISPEIDALSDIYLYTVDNLNDIVAHNQQSREEAALEAERYIERGVKRWDEWYQLSEIGDSVQVLTDYAKETQAQASRRLMNQLGAEGEAAELIEKMAAQLAGRLLHPMITHLKRLEEQHEDEMIAALLTEFRGSTK